MATTLDLIGMSVLTRAAALAGGDFNAVIKHLDVHIGEDTNAFKKLPIDEINTLLNALDAQCEERKFALAFGEIFNFDGLPELAAFVVSASSIREAAELTEWIPRLIHSAIQIDSQDFSTSAVTSLSFHYPDGSVAKSPVFAEMIAAVVKRFSAIIAPKLQALEYVQFSHSLNGQMPDYEAYFGCPVHFDRDQTLMRFDPTVLELPLPGNLPPAHAQAESSIRAKLAEDALAQDLSQQIYALYKKDISLFSQGIEGLASALHVHPRKLQRQLKAENLRFSEVLAQARQNAAGSMLANAELDIDSIGYKLGFEERRSFTAAFKKWTGKTPRAYRAETLRKPTAN